MKIIYCVKDIFGNVSYCSMSALESKARSIIAKDLAMNAGNGKYVVEQLIAMDLPNNDGVRECLTRRVLYDTFCINYIEPIEVDNI